MGTIIITFFGENDINQGINKLKINLSSLHYQEQNYKKNNIQK